MKTRQERIAVIAALIVVAGVFGVREFNQDLPISIPLIEDVARPPSFVEVSAPLVVDEIWSFWQEYLEALNNHDYDRVKFMSHDLSPTCQDPASRERCFLLMDALYNIGSYYTLDDFRFVLVDEMQVVLYTPFIEVNNPEAGITNTTMQTMLYFTRDFLGQPKALGMRFCWPNLYLTDCVETNPDKRDLNKNGWWDELESLFH